MAKKFKGTLAQLQTIVEMTGTAGQWEDKGNGHWLFRGNDQAILNWWQSSGTLNFQGPQPARGEFDQIVALAQAKFQSTQPEPITPSEPADLPPIAPIPLGRYLHYKGKEYQVLGIARHSETLEELVVYRALYGAGGLWVRPKAMFLESITHAGKRLPRFQYLKPT